MLIFKSLAKEVGKGLPAVVSGEIGRPGACHAAAQRLTETRPVLEYLMIVIISDLHLRPFADDSLRIRLDGQVHEIGFRRSVALDTFSEYLALIGELAEHCHATELHLVFAGDTFAIHQKPLNFMDVPSWTRHNEALGPDDPQQNPILQNVLGFLAATGLEHQSLRAEFQSFLRKPHGRKLRSNQTHYLPGVHDRLVNGWPATRKWAADFLQLSHPPNKPFSETLNFAHLCEADHEVHIRQSPDLKAPPSSVPVITGPRRNPAAGNH